MQATPPFFISVKVVNATVLGSHKKLEVPHLAFSATLAAVGAQAPGVSAASLKNELFWAVIAGQAVAVDKLVLAPLVLASQFALSANT
jgi:hypothetical protein